MFHFINSRVNTHCLAVLLSLFFGGRSFASAFTGLVGGAARQAPPRSVLTNSILRAAEIRTDERLSRCQAKARSLSVTPAIQFHVSRRTAREPSHLRKESKYYRMSRIENLKTYGRCFMMRGVGGEGEPMDGC